MKFGVGVRQIDADGKENQRVGLVVAVSTALAWGVHAGLDLWAGEEPPLPGRLWSAAVVAAVAGTDVVVFLLLARVLRIREVTAVLALVTRRG